MELFCGDAMCKRPAADAVAAQRKPEPWPVRCPACGTSLYPQDVLDVSRPDDLAPKRAALMVEQDGRRQPFTTAMVRSDQQPAVSTADAERILAMVDVPGETSPQRGPMSRWVWLAVALAVLAAVGVALSL